MGSLQKFFSRLAFNAANYGLLSFLLKQPNNGSSNIKIKAASVFNPITYGNWASATNYSKGTIRAYPTGSPILWTCVNAIIDGPGGSHSLTPPSISNADWSLNVGLDMVQDSGDGVHFFRTTLQRAQDDFMKIDSFQYGTFADVQFTNSVSNYEDFVQIGSSASSIATNTAIPSSKSFTADTGLTKIYDSVLLNGAFSSTFNIPIVHPNITSYTIGAGLSITEGDTLTFYGDATHFFVLSVYKYDSIAGIVYGFSVNNVGTGSFSIWSVKKEVLIYIKWTGGAVDGHLIVTAYNSGTGATTATLIASGNTAGALTGWNIFYGKKPQPIPSSQGTNFNVGGAAAAIGHYCYVNFVGTSLQHRCVTQSNGMGWTYIYVSGPNTGVPPANVIVDTYSAGTLSNQTKQVFSGLIYGTHRVVAVAMLSPNGSSTNIAPFIYASTTTTNVLSFNQNVNYDLFTSSLDVGIIDPNSHGEVAWNFRLNANPGDAVQWFPFHGVITSRDDSRVVKVDGVTINANTIDSTANPYYYKYQSFTSATLDQTGAITHPTASGDMANYVCNHTLNKNGVAWDFNFTWLQSAFISAGYNNMVSLGEAFFNKIKAVGGQYMARPADNTSVNMASDFRGQASYLFYSTSGADPAKSLVLAQYWDDLSNWRQGELNSGSSFVQDFTGATGAKFYPYVYNSYTTSVNETVRVRGRHYLGWLANANSVL